MSPVFLPHRKTQPTLCNGQNMRHFIQPIQVIDSHTGGEPTRIIVEGGPDLGRGPMAERLLCFQQQFDHLRRAIIHEPRGNEVMVGGLICPPHEEHCVAGVIFFNNHGYLGMCGHGLIGLMVTLQHLRWIESGTHRIDTPVGVVTAELKSNCEVKITNVPSFRYRSNVVLDVPEYGSVVGDVAWGGNWFFLIKNSQEELTLARAAELTSISMKIRQALADAGVTGARGAWIDHVELFGPAKNPENDSRNFVLCPGGAYDRSPCGTGTSAKLACLAADKKLLPGQGWRQESIVGSCFQGSYEWAPQSQGDPRACAEPIIIPSITGSAYICAQSTLLFHPEDPFCTGLCE
jgi:4-hydroxyproline epimerase